MAIKEEQYDPGYEDAYGGEYAQGGGAEPNQTSNGHCAFSSGKVLPPPMPSWPAGPEWRLLSYVCSTEGAPGSAPPSQPKDGQVPDGGWMTQSFADQIPDIAGGGGQTQDSG